MAAAPEARRRRRISDADLGALAGRTYSELSETKARGPRSIMTLPASTAATTVRTPTGQPRAPTTFPGRPTSPAAPSPTAAVPQVRARTPSDLMERIDRLGTVGKPVSLSPISGTAATVLAEPTPAGQAKVRSGTAKPGGIQSVFKVAEGEPVPPATTLFPPFKTREELEAEAALGKKEDLFIPGELQPLRSGKVSASKVFEQLGFKPGEASLLFSEMSPLVAQAFANGDITAAQLRELRDTLVYAFGREKNPKKLAELRQRYARELRQLSPASAELTGRQPNVAKFISALQEALAKRVAPGMWPPPVPPIVVGKKVKLRIPGAAGPISREDMLRAAVGAAELDQAFPQLVTPAQRVATPLPAPIHDLSKRVTVSQVFGQHGFSLPETLRAFPDEDLRKRLGGAVHTGKVQPGTLAELKAALEAIGGNEAALASYRGDVPHAKTWMELSDPQSAAELLLTAARNAFSAHKPPTHTPPTPPRPIRRVGPMPGTMLPPVPPQAPGMPRPPLPRERTLMGPPPLPPEEIRRREEADALEERKTPRVPSVRLLDRPPLLSDLLAQFKLDVHSGHDLFRDTELATVLLPHAVREGLPQETFGHLVHLVVDKWGKQPDADALRKRYHKAVEHAKTLAKTDPQHALDSLLAVARRIDATPQQQRTATPVPIVEIDAELPPAPLDARPLAKFARELLRQTPVPRSKEPAKTAAGTITSRKIPLVPSPRSVSSLLPPSLAFVPERLLPAHVEPARQRVPTPEVEISKPMPFQAPPVARQATPAPVSAPRQKTPAPTAGKRKTPQPAGVEREWFGAGEAASAAADQVASGARHEDSVIVDIRKIPGYHAEEPETEKLPQPLEFNVAKVGPLRRLLTRRPKGAFVPIQGEHGKVASTHATIAVQPDNKILLNTQPGFTVQLSRGDANISPKLIPTSGKPPRPREGFSLKHPDAGQVYSGNHIKIGNNTFKVVRSAGELKLVGVSGPVEDKEFTIGNKPVTIGSDPKLSHIALIAAAVKAGKKGK